MRNIQHQARQYNAPTEELTDIWRKINELITVCPNFITITGDIRSLLFQIHITAAPPNELIEFQRIGLELFSRKNSDYGDAFATFGIIGVLVRMGDKIARINTLKTRAQLVDESIRDTMLDLHNYAAMAIMLLDE
jgi:hypothetical protein